MHMFRGREVKIRLVIREDSGGAAAARMFIAQSVLARMR